MLCADLLAALETVNPPSVKQYQEASLTYLLLQHQHLIQELLLPQLLDLEKGSPATASHILAAVQACLHSKQQEQLLPQLVNLLVPWTNHHTHNIRTFAQLGLCAVLDAKPLDTWPGWQKGLGEGGVAIVQALQRFFVQNLDFQRFRKNIGAGMLHWQPDSVVSPAGIFCSSLSLAGKTYIRLLVAAHGVAQQPMPHSSVFVRQSCTSSICAGSARLQPNSWCQHGQYGVQVENSGACLAQQEPALGPFQHVQVCYIMTRSPTPHAVHAMSCVQGMRKLMGLSPLRAVPSL